MTLHAALAASATLVSLAFALSTLERWLARRRRHEGAWTVSLFMFAAGSAALWWGAAVGWGEWSFKAFYLFGAILNVPFLALGTVELLAGPTHGDGGRRSCRCSPPSAPGLVVAAPLLSFIDPDVLPQGKEVFGAGPRIAAAVASGVGAMVIFGGALWSAWRLLRGRRRAGAPLDPPRRTPGARQPVHRRRHARAERRRAAQLRRRRDGRLRHLARRRHLDHLRRLPAHQQRRLGLRALPPRAPGLARPTRPGRRRRGRRHRPHRRPAGARAPAGRRGQRRRRRLPRPHQRHPGRRRRRLP